MNIIEKAFRNTFVVKEKAGISQSYVGPGEYRYNPTYTVPFDGEKTPGSIGFVKKYIPLYSHLRNRSWELYMSSDIMKMIIDKYGKWVVGPGLKLQYEPMVNMASELGYNVTQNPEELKKEIEVRWNIWCKQKLVSRDSEMDLAMMSKEINKNVYVGGDVLITTTYDEDTMKLKVDYVDGDDVQTPLHANLDKSDAIKGRMVRHGVVIDKETGKHIAYYVRINTTEFKRLEAYDANGLRRVWLYKGKTYRRYNMRGVPIASAIMDTLKKFDRFKEASVKGAEERAKIAYFIEHNQSSTGESPLLRAARAAANQDLDNKLSYDAEYEGLARDAANKIAKTEEGTAYNLPIGSSMNAIKSDAEINLTEFQKAILQVVCAAMEMPMDVALDAYENSYSSSRAALKSWESTIKDKRALHIDFTEKPIFQLWLIGEVLGGRIQMPALINAVRRKDQDAIEALTYCRFIGAGVPHIDPVKEVEAERKKLGPEFDHIPLTTSEQSTEALGTGDFSQNAERMAQVAKDYPKPAAPAPPIPPPGSPPDGDGDGEE